MTANPSCCFSNPAERCNSVRSSSSRSSISRRICMKKTRRVMPAMVENRAMPKPPIKDSKRSPRPVSVSCCRATKGRGQTRQREEESHIITIVAKPVRIAAERIHPGRCNRVADQQSHRGNSNRQAGIGHQLGGEDSPEAENREDHEQPLFRRVAEKPFPFQFLRPRRVHFLANEFWVTGRQSILRGMIRGANQGRYFGERRAALPVIQVQVPVAAVVAQLWQAAPEQVPRSRAGL